MNQIPVSRLLELFDYNPCLGYIRRKIQCGKSKAGTIIKATCITVDGIVIGAHRVAWVLWYGEYPPEGYWVDHEDRIKAHNWASNLRLATPTQNQQNKAGCGTYPKGVTWRNRITKPWQAKIRVEGERIHLGSFATMEEAAEAYRQAAMEYHGEFACYD